MATILLVDDEASSRYAMSRALAKDGYELLEAGNGREALDVLAKAGVDAMLLDLAMPVMDGMATLKEMKKLKERPPVIVVTAHGSEKVAVEAMKAGAIDYLAKPYEIEELRVVVRKAVDAARVASENRRLKEEVSRLTGCGELIGESPAMRSVYDRIEKVAASKVPVLVRGASGTGKELVARELHRRSGLTGAFVAMNCAAIPETLIESELFGHEKGAFTGATERRKGKFLMADGGTLFLDEIGDMPHGTQAKLLRVLQEQTIEPLGSDKPLKVDVRVVSATHRDLEKGIQEGKFREDLYYRLNVVDIRLPSLSERGNDVLVLARRFLESAARTHGKAVEGLTTGAERALVSRPWPGNVRELRNVVERAVVLANGARVDEADLVGTVPSSPGVTATAAPVDLSFQDARKQVLEEFERSYLTAKLKENEGNISRTATAIGMHRQSLQQKLKELGVNPHLFKG
ncbi:MAG: sigma-54 dependent transcriptional regulator [Planctomycetota bacterium]